MNGPCFVDTNVLVYVRDASEPEKQPRAHAWLQRLWTTHQGRISTQVLSEFYVTVTRKLQPGLSRQEARADVSSLLSWHPLPVDARLLTTALALEDRFELSWWDALIVGAGQSARCAWLLTEDLQDGQEFDDLRVVNPFFHEPADVMAS